MQPWPTDLDPIGSGRSGQTVLARSLMSQLPPAIFLMGPTAAGKTDLAIELTKVLPCELISVDSALVYRGMDIGTAKPSKELLAQYPHRLIDILDPAQSYSAADFLRDALEAMAEITARGKICLLYTSPSPRDRTRSRMPSSA